MIELIPYIRSSLHPFMNSPKHFASLQLLDNASDDINVHIHQIFDKFASIITERLQAHLENAESYQQALLQQKEQQQESSVPMERFLKELGSLHRVLDQYLSPEQMQEVFKLVFNSVERVYTDILSKCDSTNDIIVSMITLDANKLCTTAEGLKNSPMKLETIQSTVTEMKNHVVKKEVPVVEEDPVPEVTTSMTVVEEEEQNGNNDDENNVDEDNNKKEEQVFVQEEDMQGTEKLIEQSLEQIQSQEVQEEHSPEQSQDS